MVRRETNKTKKKLKKNSNSAAQGCCCEGVKGMVRMGTGAKRKKQGFGSGVNCSVFGFVSYVYTYVCMYVYTYVCMYVCTYIILFVYMGLGCRKRCQTRSKEMSNKRMETHTLLLDRG